MPTKSKYGGWPRSGEIDLMESRGNLNYVNEAGKHIGVEQSGATVHFGPAWDQNGWQTAHNTTNTEPGHGFNRAFHKYQMEWTPQHIHFSIDDKIISEVNVDDGFWIRGNFSGENIWSNGTQMAPFDEEVSSYINSDCIFIL